jgi:hypothetical protein
LSKPVAGTGAQRTGNLDENAENGSANPVRG